MPHLQVAALAAMASVARTALRNGDASQTQLGGHPSPAEICLEVLAAPPRYQSPALRCSPEGPSLPSGTAFPDTAAVERERCRGLPNRSCQMDEEQRNAFKMEREFCLGRTKLRKETRQDLIQRPPWLKSFSGSARWLCAGKE